MAQTKQYQLKGILNNDPTLAADFVLANGTIEQKDTATTGVAWGQSIPYYEGMTYRITPFTLGQFKEIKLVTNGETPVIGQSYSVVVRSSTLLTNTFGQKFEVFAATTSITDLIDAFVALINASSGSQLVASNSADDLVLEGKFGDINTEVYDWTVTMQGFTVSQTVTAALVQPSGTPEIVKNYIPAAFVTKSQYNTYEVYYENPEERIVVPNTWNKAVAVCFVCADTDILFASSFQDIMDGAATAADYLSRKSV